MGTVNVIKMDEVIWSFEELIKLKDNEIISLAEELLSEKIPSLEKVSLIKQVLLFKDFHRPYKHLVGLIKALREEKEEKGDLKKQIEHFKKVASAKRATIFKIALSEASLKIYHRLKALSYTDLLPYLPIHGEFLDLILIGGHSTILSFRRLKDDLLNSGILKNSFSARAVAVSSVAYAYDVVIEKFLEEDREEVKKYNEILRKHKVIPYTLAEELDGFEELKKELKERELGEMDYGEFKTNEKLKEEIIERRKALAEEVYKVASGMLAGFILRFYLEKGKTQRMVERPFPSLRVSITPEIASWIADKLGNKRIVDLLLEKRNMEGKIPSRELSIALVAKHLGTEFAVKYFKVNKEEVEEAKSILESLSGKGGEFLRMLEEEKRVKDTKRNRDSFEEDKDEN